MRRMMIPAIALAITLVPATLAAQTPEQRGPRGPGGAPVERLIEHRDELGLSVQQVAELRRIQAQLQEKNRPLVEQLQAARPQRQALTAEQRQQMRQKADSARQRMQQMTPEQREQMRERMQQMMPEQRQQMRQRMQRPGMNRMPEELQPVMQQMRANTQDAARQVQAVLTAEQRQKLAELRPARRGPRAAR